MKNKRRAKPDRLDMQIRLPNDVFKGQVRLTIMGSGQALVENFLSVLELTDTMVRLSCRKGSLIIEGEKIWLTQVRPDALMVRGKISTVRLPLAGEQEGQVTQNGG